MCFDLKQMMPKNRCRRFFNIGGTFFGVFLVEFGEIRASLGKFGKIALDMH